MRKRVSDIDFVETLRDRERENGRAIMREKERKKREAVTCRQRDR